MKIKMQENKEKIIELLKSTKRDGIDDLINWMEKSGYFESPASSKYHFSIEGGLAQHSLTVYEILLKLNDCFNIGFSKEIMIITGLLHDVCKIGIYKWYEKEELINPSDRHDNSKRIYKGYIRNDTFPIGHGEKSIILVQKYIKLTDKEIAMIRWHMSMYDPAFSMNQKDIYREFPEVMWLYFADHISTLFMEKE